MRHGAGDSTIPESGGQGTSPGGSTRARPGRKRNFNPDRLRQVVLASVRPNRWNPKPHKGADYDRILRSVRENGLRLPVVVRSFPGQEYEILDGEQRYHAAVEVGYRVIWVYDEGELDDQTAKELTLWYQEQVPFDEGLLAPLVVNLADLPDPVIPFNEREIDEFRDILKFPGAGTLNLTGKGAGGKIRVYLSEEALARVLEIEKEDQGPDEKFLELSFIERIPVTAEQKEIIDKAVRNVENSYKVPKGRALELICADYLSGAPPEE